MNYRFLSAEVVTRSTFLPSLAASACSSSKDRESRSELIVLRVVDDETDIGAIRVELVHGTGPKGSSRAMPYSWQLSLMSF